MLLLGGTREARELAEALSDDGRWKVISSLAGRTRDPEAVPSEIRVGGFGGMDGLAAFLKEGAIDLVVDATHPFAEVISRNAVGAAGQLGLPYLRLCRPAWRGEAGDRWQSVANVQQAADVLSPGHRVFLTIGRQKLAPFFARDDVRIVARMIEAPTVPVPPHVEIILARPPFEVSDEAELMQAREINVLVTKNAGGPSVESKLIAARNLGLPVIMIERSQNGVPVDAETVAELIVLLDRHYAT